MRVTDLEVDPSCEAFLFREAAAGPRRRALPAPLAQRPAGREPKVPAAVQGLLDRGLLEIRAAGAHPRAFFTAAGLEALRQLAARPRLLDPLRFRHLRIELGLQAAEPCRRLLPVLA